MACGIACAVEVSQDPKAYTAGLQALADAGVPFMVGGGYALAVFSGIRRTSADLDVVVCAEDAAAVLATLERAGFTPSVPYPHWLAKAMVEGHCIDVIWSSGNGAAPVDRVWFEHAPRARVLGVDVRVCPPEEMIWSKAFVMERERYDGADVAHLLLACGHSLDWERLLGRFGEHWRVLFAHLTLFAYIYPGEADRIPAWVTQELVGRASCPPAGAAGSRVCRGTLLSREQYLPDLARGWRDGRLQPDGPLSREAIALWTNAIAKR